MTARGADLMVSTFPSENIDVELTGKVRNQDFESMNAGLASKRSLTRNF